MIPNRILSLIQNAQNEGAISRDEVRKVCAGGMSEPSPGERCFAWLILFGVFPKSSKDWDAKLSAMCASYEEFVSECKVGNWLSQKIPKYFSKKDFKDVVENGMLMYDIHTDVVRSSRNLFFLPAEEPPEDMKDDKLGPFIYHLRRVERILYIFGMMNPILRYIQGFNELLIPIYFVVSSAGEYFNNNNETIEALTFQCFQHLMTSTNIIDFFLINDLTIMEMKFSYFKKLLVKHAPNAAKILEHLQISPFEYVYRWLNILFSQEYELPSLLVLWDSIFSNFDDLMNYACYIAVIKINEIEDELDKDHFTKTVIALQTEKNQNIYSIINKANLLYNKDLNLD